MRDEIAERRAKLLGPAPQPDLSGLLATITNTQAANAELSEALRSTVMSLLAVTKEQKSEGSAEANAVRAELAAAREELASVRGMLAEECEARARLEGELAVLRASKQPPPQIDTGALVSAIVSAIPAPKMPDAPPRAKSFNLDTKDAMGNPRRVRITPEY